MDEYPKIHTIYKRYMSVRRKLLLEGEWSLPEFEYLANTEWEFTEKVDGTNIRVIVENGKVRFGGRTDRAQIPARLVTVLERTFMDNAPLAALKDIILYGEGYGSGIQNGASYLPDRCDFILFDVRIGKWWLRRSDVEQIASQLGIQCVPVVGRGTLLHAVLRVKAGIPSMLGPCAMEGLVMRPVCELLNRSGERIIAKVKQKDFAKL
jgi:ATP-dependent RNA circularization protein (DNA/RNA ligase family)